MKTLELNQINLTEDYTPHQARMVNVIRDVDVINDLFASGLNSYGANEYVNYLAPFFEKISISQGNIPVMQIQNEDFILITIRIPGELGQNPKELEWHNNHNLLHFTPYFYDTTVNGKPCTIFGSIDNSIFFTADDLAPGNEIKICTTASKSVAAYYQEQGYLISKIPSNYNQAVNASTFNFAIRLGSVKPEQNDAIDANDYIDATYYEASDNTNQTDFFLSEEIRSQLKLGNVVPSSDVADQLEEIKASMDQQDNLTQFVLFPYLSQLINPPSKRAIKNFYQSVELSSTPNAQADNTQENYFTSVAVDLNSIIDPNSTYLHIVCGNQKTMGAALTSNVQIYRNSQTAHDAISLGDDKVGLIPTAPNLPPFAVKNYPHMDKKDNIDMSDQYPDYSIYSILISDIIDNNGSLGKSPSVGVPVDQGGGIIVVERFSYNPSKLSYSVYTECEVSKAYVGPALDSSYLSSLQEAYPNLNLDNAVGSVS